MRIRIALDVDINPDKWAEDYGLDPHDLQAIRNDITTYLESVVRSHLINLDHDYRPNSSGLDIIPAGRVRVGDRIAVTPGPATVVAATAGDRTVILRSKIKDGTYYEMNLLLDHPVPVRTDTERTS